LRFPNRKAKAELVLQRIDEDSIHAFYSSTHNVIVLDACKLSKLIADKSYQAREVHVDLGDLEQIWIAKFASIISHEIIHDVVTELGGNQISRQFDSLYFPEFMEKIPKHSVHITLWADAYETCPIGDTWFA